MKTLRFALAAVSALLLSACISRIDVQPYDTDKPVDGFVYSLPSPFVMVTPRADGGIDVQQLYLPDSSAQYAVKAQSFLSAYKMDLTFEHGMLKAYSGKIDSTALASAVLAGTGEVLKQRFETQAAEKAEEMKAAQEARKAIAEAQVEYGQALAEQATLEEDDNAKAEAKLEAAVKVARAKAKLEALLSAADLGGFNVLGGAQTPEVVEVDAWGPILYQVQEEGGNVVLEQVAPQIAFRTIKVQKKEEKGAEPNKVVLKLKVDGPIQRESGKWTFQLEADKDLKETNTVNTLLTKVDGGAIPFNNDNYVLKVNKDNSRLIDVVFNDTIESGKYTITPAGKTADDKMFAAEPVSIEIAP